MREKTKINQIYINIIFAFLLLDGFKNHEVKFQTLLKPCETLTVHVSSDLLKHLGALNLIIDCCLCFEYY